MISSNSIPETTLSDEKSEDEIILNTVTDDQKKIIKLFLSSSNPKSLIECF